MLQHAESVTLQAGLFAQLLDVLKNDGYRLIGPRVRNGAVVYDDIANVNDLPRGISDEQSPGRYRIASSGSDRMFDYVVGPTSWKRFLYPPRRKLWEATRDDRGAWQPEPAADECQATAFIGVRACEISAIRILDRVLNESAYPDSAYAKRRRATFILAVGCAVPAATCFCTSVGGGPSPEADFDIALTELGTGDSHRFVLRAGSETGRGALRRLTDHLSLKPTALQATSEADQRAVDEQVRRSVGQITAVPAMGRAREILGASLRSDHWETVADRCLSCANCTMACPTCFCVDVEDVTDLTGTHAERWQQWDSCFTLSHSYLHGGSVRKTTASRYRQWLTHKLDTWHDQFGTSGCVGCGRCITWCPAGIDIRDELATLDSEVSEEAKAT